MVGLFPNLNLDNMVQTINTEINQKASTELGRVFILTGIKNNCYWKTVDQKKQQQPKRR